MVLVLVLVHDVRASVCVCVWAVIGGVIGMAAFIRFKNDVANIMNAGETDPNFYHVTFHNGFKLHTAAWIVSLLAFFIALAAKQPSKAAQLAQEAVGAV